MGGGKEIGRRLRAVQGTAKITRAMQLVASSKMARAQRAALGGRRHEFRLEELADLLLREGPAPDPALCAPREVQRRGIVTVATDRGLCGALNQNVLRAALALDGPARFVAIGRRGAQLLAARGKELLAEFSINDRVPFAQVRSIANYLRDIYLSGTVDTVEVLYPVFVNTLEQRVLAKKLLPLDGLAENLRSRRAILPALGNPLPEDPRPLLVEPSRARLAEKLVEEFFRRELFQLLLEAKAAEQSARTVAMKLATDNAEALAKELRMEFNKLRQATITGEILEITAAGTVG
ncbi:MAG: ATP synthase F1 subunit gamma [Puniceicoccales bacterium]|jgi:F-type H+-transporting ATPase subunit gamma|nr:ATP synthase F1 subunit gamma [Puniceicoccales bacterium]